MLLLAGRCELRVEIFEIRRRTDFRLSSAPEEDWRFSVETGMVQEKTCELGASVTADTGNCSARRGGGHDSGSEGSLFRGVDGCRVSQGILPFESLPKLPVFRRGR